MCDISPEEGFWPCTSSARLHSVSSYPVCLVCLPPLTDSVRLRCPPPPTAIFRSVKPEILDSMTGSFITIITKELVQAFLSDNPPAFCLPSHTRVAVTLKRRAPPPPASSPKGLRVKRVNHSAFVFAGIDVLTVEASQPLERRRRRRQQSLLLLLIPPAPVFCFYWRPTCIFSNKAAVLCGPGTHLYGVECVFAALLTRVQSSWYASTAKIHLNGCTPWRLLLKSVFSLCFFFSNLL